MDDSRPPWPHVPVLVAEILELLAPADGELFVDATVGAGGHSEALLTAGPHLRILGLDRDPRALEIASRRLAPFEGRFELVESDYRSLPAILDRRGIEAIDGLLADLGVSSMQLDDPARGFSFRFDAPLDLRMGLDGPTGADVVNDYTEQDLVRIFRDYGEEPMARAIARRITSEREKEPIRTTGRLARIVAEAKRGRDRDRERRIDPATRAFQALRIEVNRELEGLDRFLEETVERLRPRGRLAVVSFHSLEDRIVKRTFRSLGEGCRCAPGMPVCGCGRRKVLEILTGRPIRPTPAETTSNPRSRSARLRAARRVGP
jgi:16S rRNA (cytosine1402-N4)-methyltransferase